MRPINASDADNATRHERSGETAREAVSPSGSRKARSFGVGEKDDILGQQKINKAVPNRSNRLELFRLNQAVPADDPERLTEVSVHS
jgi:hypothetical protein